MKVTALRMLLANLSLLPLAVTTQAVSAELESVAPQSGYALIGYSAGTGEFWVDDWVCETDGHASPRAEGFTTVHLLSDSEIFVNNEAAGTFFSGIFDQRSAKKLFRLNPTGLKGASLGRVAEAGLTEELLLADLDWDASHTTCGETSQFGLTYFPPPNLSESAGDDLASDRLIYNAADGEFRVDLRAGGDASSVGFYSASGIFADEADTHEIDARIQYQFDVTDVAPLAAKGQTQLSRQELLADLAVVVSDSTNRPTSRNVELVYLPVGDINENSQLDVGDIDQLTEAIKDGLATMDFDFSGDGIIDNEDRIFWIERVANTYVGDANLDGQFDSSDFNTVFQAGEYFDDVPGNSSWATGDWNGDGDFTSGDFVAAFKSGGYEQGTRPVAVVPEPNGLLLFVVGLIGCGARRRS